MSEELPIDELLCCADVCISDYSSLVRVQNDFLARCLGHNPLEALPAASAKFVVEEHIGAAHARRTHDAVVRKIRFVRAMATAQYVVLNDASSLVSCVPLRPETTVVQLWHGCGAFKKWGMSTPCPTQPAPWSP